MVLAETSKMASRSVGRLLRKLERVFGLRAMVLAETSKMVSRRA